jgi:hypothetical protein
MSSTHKMTSMFAMACGIGAAVASAQTPAPGVAPLPQEDTLFFLQNIAPLPAFGAKIDILSSEASVAGPVVKGKPYSARSITESIQTLADGNRIVQRNETMVYRDSEGRTRREQTLGGVGPWATGEPTTTIHIHDPVANKTYMLDPAARIMREIRPFRMAIAHAEQIEAANAGLDVAHTEGRTVYRAAVPAPAPLPGPEGGRGVVTVIRGTAGGDHVRVFAPSGDVPLPTDVHAAMGAYEPAEELGEQVLEGLTVQGTRMRDTIPAGLMGNERPIEIVTERWFSKDLDAMVLQRFADPRFGETTSKLVNVVLGDPSPDLFEVPQGYEFRKADEGPSTAILGAPGHRVEFELRRNPGAPAR